MNKIRIGIDVDEVLRDFVGRISDLAYEETGIRVQRPSTYYYDIEKETGISFRDKIWGTGEWAEKVFEGASLVDNAKEGYDAFMGNDRYDVYIVTTQSKDTEHHTLNWLKDNGFTGYKDIYVTKDKLEAPCQILVDDKIDNVKAYNENARLAYLADRPHNQEYETNRRVNDLLDAYQKITERYG